MAGSSNAPVHGASDALRGRRTQPAKQEPAAARPGRKRLVDSEEEEEEEEDVGKPDAMQATAAAVSRRGTIIESEDDDEVVIIASGHNAAPSEATEGDRRGRGGARGKEVVGSADGARGKKEERSVSSRRKPKTVVVDDSEAEDSMSEEDGEEEDSYGEDDGDLDHEQGVQGLLEDVEQIGAKLTSALDSMKEDSKKIGQPASLGDAKLRLKGYQLVGLNWLRVLHETDVNGILAGECVCV